MPAIEVLLDEIDDPVFDLSRFTLRHGVFSLEGHVDLSRGRLLSGRPIPTAIGGEHRGEWTRHQLLFRADGVESFEISDDAGLGEIILDSIDMRPGAIRLQGVIPCSVVLRTAEGAWSRLELGPTIDDRGHDVQLPGGEEDG